MPITPRARAAASRNATVFDDIVELSPVLYLPELPVVDRVGFEPTTPGLSLEVNPTSCLLSRYVHLTRHIEAFRRGEEKFFLFFKKTEKERRKSVRAEPLLALPRGDVLLYVRIGS